MLSTIKKRLLSILEADARLYAGGESFEAGWTGVKRIANGTGFQAGYVNLFGTRLSSGSTANRPAIYLGTKNFKFLDKLEYESCVKDGKIEYRMVMVPLVICALAQEEDAEEQAEAQCYQLENNVRQILFDPENIIAAGAWYNLTLAHETDERDIGASGTGESEMQSALSTTILPVEVHYSYKVGSPA